MEVTHVACPLCGYYLHKKMYPYFGDPDTWLAVKEIGGAERMKVTRRYDGELLASNGHQWFLRAKQAVGALACKLGLVKLKAVAKKVNVSYLKDVILELRGRLKSLTGKIKTREKKIYKLKIQIANLKRINSGYKNAWAESYGVTVGKTRHKKSEW